MSIYIGIGSESGRTVREEDAFMYAMERVTTVEKDMEEFCEHFTGVRYGMATKKEIMDFREDLVNWFYSGNWIRSDENVGQKRSCSTGNSIFSF